MSVRRSTSGRGTDTGLLFGQCIEASTKIWHREVLVFWTASAPQICCTDHQRQNAGVIDIQAGILHKGDEKTLQVIF